MNIKLHIILILVAILFFIFITNMIRKTKLHLQYALTWLISSIIFVVIAVFPGIVNKISVILNIKEPVNALFLLIIFLMINIIFTLSMTVSKLNDDIKVLTQEVGISKFEIEKIKSKR